jgi:pterin-4a-carbinolamine dehydratase
MKVKIETISPYGLLVTFLKSFYFDTYEEAMDFIKEVERLADEHGRNKK